MAVEPAKARDGPGQDHSELVSEKATARESQLEVHGVLTQIGSRRMGLPTCGGDTDQSYLQMVSGNDGICD